MSEMAWAGGLFEGEGWISTSRRGTEGNYLHICVQSTDEDVIRRFAVAIGVGAVNGPYAKQGPEGQDYKPYWLWSCTRHEEIKTVVRALWPWLCRRRREQIEKAFVEAESAGLGRRRKEWRNPPWATITQPELLVDAA